MLLLEREYRKYVIFNTRSMNSQLQHLTNGQILQDYHNQEPNYYAFLKQNPSLKHNPTATAAAIATVAAAVATAASNTSKPTRVIQSDLPFYYSHHSTAPVLNDQEQYPSFKEFDNIVQEYLQNLSSKKRDKALVDQHRYSLILQVLKDPRNTAISTAQFRFWVKKMFQLAPTNSMDVVCHDNKPVAMREQIYSILVRAHREAHHGGRDKTSALVRRRYSWIPKELIARFVRQCPFCISRRNGCTSPTMNGVPKSPQTQIDQTSSPALPCLSSIDTKPSINTSMDYSVDTKPFEDVSCSEPLWQHDPAYYYQPPPPATAHPNPRMYLSMAASVATTAAAAAVASSSTYIGGPPTPSSPFDASFYYSQQQNNHNHHNHNHNHHHNHHNHNNSNSGMEFLSSSFGGNYYLNDSQAEPYSILDRRSSHNASDISYTDPMDDYPSSSESSCSSLVIIPGSSNDHQTLTQLTQHQQIQALSVLSYASSPPSSEPSLSASPQNLSSDQTTHRIKGEELNRIDTRQASLLANPPVGVQTSQSGYNNGTLFLASANSTFYSPPSPECSESSSPPTSPTDGPSPPPSAYSFVPLSHPSIGNGNTLQNQMDLLSHHRLI
ncbi:hypothetical protein PHYBLDRAFT_58897 [Phycomyces blakesleeanus NRRL 1555(-)]|uniref:Integrase zinc-binding domain-containing protein n=2 Tax=Phycomyces blakesleeanus TaxID=4837 RepID=A0A167QKR5_PHYB8|nr:hypothetical protein PHYBLDRAFT_58897 [Phycomyces blakesleeanus NRRL 1555(-)]OAD79850.1 hypothetical protein PHYBLDRAFT_58897 [Phycomyces blakesleeanus NRRL 1555(-)]|eukprot:XP_018297890.1 hypothetical protein PHYBLDRAFT_58897 [Phycomyces blakesleeanus NRRL 1555(-)]